MSTLRATVLRRPSPSLAMQQPLWQIDPQNVSGVASDGNSGLPGAPLLTYNELASNRWQTTSPRLQQQTTITFLSSHTDNTDPIVLNALLERGASLIVQGAAPRVVVAGIVLAGTTARNHAAGANSLLITTLGASGAVGQLIENTTGGKSSRAWAYKSLGGNSFSLTNPFAKVAVPLSAANYQPAQVNTWANGDTVNLLQPVAVNIAQLSALTIDANGAIVATNGVFLYQLTIFDPLGTSNDSCAIGDSVNVAECSAQRGLVYDASRLNQALNNNGANRVCLNAFMQGGLVVNAGISVGEQNIVFLGGALGPSNFGNGITGGQNVFDGDFIFGSTCAFFGTTVFGVVYLDASHTGDGRIRLVNRGAYGNALIYGSAGSNINVRATNTLSIPGTFVATFTAPALINPGIQLNGASTGNSIAYAANVGTIHNGIATTPANLDAAAGAAGFGGTAFNPGGASVTSQLG